MVGVAPEKKYLIINHSGNPAYCKARKQLCLPPHLVGRPALKAGEETVLKGKDLTEHMVAMGLKFKRGVAGAWLEIKEYKSGKKTRLVSQEAPVAEAPVVEAQEVVEAAPEEVPSEVEAPVEETVAEEVSAEKEIAEEVVSDSEEAVEASEEVAEVVEESSSKKKKKSSKKKKSVEGDE